MRINNLKINSFGKLHNIEINLKDGINIIKGNNESGKSTILKFIINSFYGTSRNKKGKDISDFEKFKPWEGEDFSGKLSYELDNGEKFEVYREFNKKNPKIFNENLEDISKKFSIDKSKGIEFFYEQTKIDEQLFLSTSAILQQEVKIEKNMQTTLIQKIANLVGTGDDNVSFKRAMDRIERRQLNEIGTGRSREKPINILEKQINERKSKIEELEKYEKIQYEYEEEKKEVEKEIKKDEIKFELLKEIKKINEKKEIEKEKIKIQENIKNENIEKINSVKDQLEKLNLDLKKEQKEKNKNEKLVNKKIKTKIIIYTIILIAINILQFILIKNKTIGFAIMLLSVVFEIMMVYISTVSRQRKLKDDAPEDDKNNEINRLKNELNILEDNKKTQEDEINKINNELNLKFNLENEKIINNYKNEIDEKEIINYINSEKINYLLDNLQKIINDKKIKIHTIDISKNNSDEKLEVKTKLEEELTILLEQYENLTNLNLSINLAKEVLNASYEKMKDTVTPKFTEQLSETISKITDGKYTNVKYNDELGLVVETDNGNYVLADRLSTGTIDQMYLSLRLSIIKELSEERIPIFMDETFAYYDDERLKNILKYINENFKDLQIVVFTCTNREQKLLDELNVEYNKINIE